MEKHVRRFINNLSYSFIALATLLLLLLFLYTPSTCLPPHSHSRFPTSTCDLSPRPYLSPDRRRHRIYSTKAWSTTVLSYTSLFKSLQSQNQLFNHSRVLISSAGPGHAVSALNQLGIEDVTAVEIVESPPLVTRADPHNLPFMDEAFDLGFGVYLDRALFVKRYVEEMERTVRGGGICVVTVEECGMEEVERIGKVFEKSVMVDVGKVVLGGEKRMKIVMKVKEDA